MCPRIMSPSKVERPVLLCHSVDDWVIVFGVLLMWVPLAERRSDCVFAQIKREMLMLSVCQHKRFCGVYEGRRSISAPPLPMK